MKIVILLGCISLVLSLAFSPLATPASGSENTGIANYYVVSPRGVKINEMITNGPTP